MSLQNPRRRESDAARVPGVPPRFDPADIVEVEINGQLPVLGAGTRERVLVVVRLCGEPIGMLFRDIGEVDTPETLSAAITHDLQAELGVACAAHGVTDARLTPAGLPHADCPYLAGLARAATNGPPITVVIPSLNGEDRLERCIESLFRSQYHSFEVLVVDNGSRTDRPAELCRELAERLGSGTALRFITALGTVSAARNAGWSAVDPQHVVAYIDDDERPDEWWLASIGREFMRDANVGFVTGLILPAELETPAQARFENFGGHSKGRGFGRVRFDAQYTKHVQSPLYPVPPFGAGGNMSFRHQALAAVGGFDGALFTSEDTHILSEVLLARWRGVYTPDALVWHPHHREDDARDRQLRNYAIGLGMYYSALVVRRPRRLVALARLLPRALRHARSAGPSDPEGASGPRALARPSMDIRGLLRGPLAYARSRAEQRRAGGS